MHRLAAALLVSAVVLTGLPARAEGPVEDWEADLLAWRERRLARLQSDSGWLTLVGLHPLEPGEHTLGSAEINDIVLPVGPDVAGSLVVEDGEVRASFLPAADVRQQGERVTETDMVDDLPGEPTVLTLDRLSFYVIERAGALFLRVKDPESPARKGFVGLDSYPPDPAWRFEARFEQHPADTTLEIANIVGFVEQAPSWGTLVFTAGGEEHRLDVLAEPGDEQLFVIFGDETNRDETYGAGRYLYTDPPDESGRVVVDFNRAYNPPCAFTAYATCPLPPRQNRLPLRVTAGEKRYAGEH